MIQFGSNSPFLNDEDPMGNIDDGGPIFRCQTIHSPLNSMNPWKNWLKSLDSVVRNQMLMIMYSRPNQNPFYKTTIPKPTTIHRINHDPEVKDDPDIDYESNQESEEELIFPPGKKRKLYE